MYGTDYTGYAASTASDHVPLFPIITFGKYTENNGKLTLPLTITIAHAAMDGWHTSEFFREMQKELQGIELGFNSERHDDPDLHKK